VAARLTSGETEGDTPPEDIEATQLVSSVRTLQTSAPAPEASATYVGPSDSQRQQGAAQHVPEKQKVRAGTNIVEITSAVFEELKKQLEFFQIENNKIKHDLESTKQVASSKDIQLQREINQLSQREQHALQQVQETKNTLEQARAELQTTRLNQIQAVQQERIAQDEANQKEIALQATRYDLQTSQQQQQQQIQQIQQAADIRTTAAKTAEQQAAQTLAAAQAQAAQALATQQTADQQ